MDSRAKRVFRCSLERVQPPFPFGQIQAADLSDWRGDEEHRELGDLVAHLRNRLDRAQMTMPSPERNELPLEPAITNADAKIRAKPPATDEESENLKPGIRAPAVWLAATVGILRKPAGLLAALVGMILAVLWFIVPYIGVREQAAGEVFRDPMKGGGEAPEMVVIPAGSFLMGSPADEYGRSEDEGPRHEVTIARPFALARYEVTFAEYDAFSVHDILGNVWEWTEDCGHENYDGAPEDGSAWTQGGDCNLRVARGGSWGSAPDDVRSAERWRNDPDERLNFLGFRLARTAARIPLTSPGSLPIE